MSDAVGILPAGNRQSSMMLLLLRFGLAGLLNTAFGYAAFAVLLLAGLWQGAALVAATVAGMAFNFQTSRRFVFASPGNVFRFISMYVIVLGLNWTALRALTGIGMTALAAQALLVLPAAALSFVVQKALVFCAPADRG